MEFVKTAAEDAYDRLIFPSLEREMRTALTEKASEGAIGQFALNLKPLLMQPPVKGKVTMGLDPGYRMAVKSRWWTAPARCWIPPWSIPPTGAAEE